MDSNEKTHNRLFLWGGILFALYWVAGLLSPPIWFSVLVSSILLIGGLFVSVRTVPEALSIMRKDLVGPGELGVVALALISGGAVYAGAFTIAYYWMEKPQSWLGVVSSFSRAMMGLGFFILFLSPEATRKGIRLPSWYVMVLIVALTAVVVFILGVLTGQSYSLSELTRGARVIPPLVRTA